MLEYIELGPTPAEESCAQLGADDYDERVKIEGRAYIAQLIRQFGTPPTGVSLRLKAFPHDFGSYHEIVVQFDDNDEAASDWAYNVEAHTPGEWDDEARDAITRPAADTVGALNLPT